MFAYNSAFVNYQVSADHEYMDVEDYYSSFQYKVSSKLVHRLHVRTLDIEANVRMETGYEYSTAVVISCLLAALKNIDDGYVYSLARKTIESQMGFEVDDYISPGVANMLDIQYHYGDNTVFNLEVVARMFPGGIQKPSFELIKKDLQWDVTLRFNYHSGVHKGYIDMLIDPDLIMNSNAVQHAQNALWAKAYETMYMMGPDLSYMRYSLGMLNGGKYHKGGFAPPPKNVNFSGPIASGEQSGYGGKDKRVDVLPGVKEIVKNPVTGTKATLERVIINLNDQQKWTREQIADWLETLDIDISFKVKVEDEQD